MMRRFPWLIFVAVLGLLPAGVVRAACCIEGCGSTTPGWVSCTTTSTCTGGVCPGPIGSAIAFDPAATCGVGPSPFDTCPATETGQCADGVNNDVWTGDTLTDCADSDCFVDPVCGTRAPAVGVSGFIALFALLTASGLILLRQRRARGSLSPGR
jgi:hypothetical protein